MLRSNNRAGVCFIGGIDPTGGAGLTRDVWSARAWLADDQIHAIVSMWTWQGGGRPARSREVDAHYFAAELDVIHPTIIKVGALGPARARSLLAWHERHPDVRLVIDPVLQASDGGELAQIDGAWLALLERAALITPNTSEAQSLVSEPDASPSALLGAMRARWPNLGILLKGGHSEQGAARVCDRVALTGRVREYSRNRHAGPDPRGTGCALASAVASAWLLRSELGDAIELAIAWLDVVRVRVRRSPRGGWLLQSTAAQGVETFEAGRP